MAGVVYQVELRSVDDYIRSLRGPWRPLTPKESDILFVAATRVVQAIKDRWPVDTGTSRDRWNFTLYPPGTGRTGFVIENPMFYAEYVHRRGTREPIWSTLIPAAVNALMPVAVEAIKREIQRTETARQRQGTQPQAFTLSPSQQANNWLNFFRGVNERA